MVDPTRPDAGSATFWLGCAPTDDTTLSPCSNTDALLSLTSASDGGLPKGVSILGLGTSVTVQAPPNTFAADAGTAERQTGVLASAVVIAAAAPPPTTPDQATALLNQVRDGSVAHQIALFRYPISESTEPNHNPALEGYVVNGETLPHGATVRLSAPDASVDVAVTDTSFEPYVEHAPSGDLQRTETLSARYYTTNLDVDTEAVEVHGTPLEKLSPEDNASAASLATPGHVWTVVRDTRGGQSWIDAPTFVCDPGLPAPSASSVSFDGGTLVVAGSNLTSVLDVQLGDALAFPATCDAQTCTARIAPDTAGSYPLVLRAKTCANVETGQSVSVP